MKRSISEIAFSLKNLESENPNLTGKLEPEVIKEYTEHLRQLADTLKELKGF